jgi:hypothetical protein
MELAVVAGPALSIQARMYPVVGQFFLKKIIKLAFSAF